MEMHPDYIKGKHKVDGSFLVTNLMLSHVFEWWVVRCKSKNIKEIGVCSNKLVNYSKLNNQHN